MGTRKQAIVFATLPFLVAGNIFSAPEAEAQFEISVTGFTTEWFLTDPLTDDRLQDHIGDDVLFTIVLEGTADNGLRYGAVPLVDDQVTSANVGVDESFLFLNGPFGQVNIDPASIPSFSTGAFNGGNGGNPNDFVDQVGGNTSLLDSETQATQALFDGVLGDGFNQFLIAGFNYVASGPGDSFPDDPTLLDALLAWGAVNTPLDARAALTFSGQNGVGPQNVDLPSLADDTTLVFGLELKSSEVNFVPLPAAVWFFLGALGSLGLFRWLRPQKAG